MSATPPEESGSRKAAVRRDALARRAAITPADRARRSEDIARRLFEIDAFASARCVLVYLSFASEVATEATVARLVADGRRVLAPVLRGDRLLVSPIAAVDAVTRSAAGFPEPQDARDRAVHPRDAGPIDAALVPGTAFDRRGNRVGRGGGHYDRLLAELSPNTLRIGLAFGEQIVEELPSEPHDQRVDLIVTDAETVRCPGGR